MTRLRKATFIVATAALVGGGWTTEAAAQRYGAHVRGQVVHGRPYYRGVYYPRAYYPRIYFSYWSPWYGPWPYWWYGAYWPGPYYGPYYYEPTGSLRVQVAPRETRVYVDGYYVGTADDFDGVFQRLRVSPGGHEIVLHLPGYRNATQRLYLQPGSTYSLKHDMEPLPSGTPDEPVPRPNPDAVRPERDRDSEGYGREPDPRDPNGTEPRPAPRSPEAGERPREARYGSLAIRVQPSDARVFIDGTEWRGGADDSGEILVQVPAGRHRIELQREGFVTFATEVDVRPGVTTPVNVLLQTREE